MEGLIKEYINLVKSMEFMVDTIDEHFYNGYNPVDFLEDAICNDIIDHCSSVNHYLEKLRETLEELDSEYRQN